MRLDAMLTRLRVPRTWEPSDSYAHVLGAAPAFAGLDPDRVPVLLMGLLFIADAAGWVERAIADATDVLDRVDANDDAHHLVQAFIDGANLLLPGDPARAADRLTERSKSVNTGAVTCCYRSPPSVMGSYELERSRLPLQAVYESLNAR
jgi:hypothetical protein